MTESLLDKWAVNKGSLLSSSVGPLKSDLLSSSGQVRKRKTDVGLTTKPAEWKKIKETERPDLSLKSSLFSSYTKSSMLDSYGKSSLFTNSTLAESTNAKHNASEPLHTSRESTRPTLISMSRAKTELGGGIQFKSLTTGSSLLSSGLLSSSSLGGTSVFSKKPESSGTSLLGTSLSGSLLTSGTTSKLESSLLMAQPSSSLGQSPLLQGRPSSSLGQFSVHVGQPSTSLGHSSLFKDQPINTGSTLMAGNYSVGSSGLSTGATSLMKNSINSSLGMKQSEGASASGTSKKQKTVTMDTKKGKKRTRSDRYSAPPPEYHLTNEIEETAEIVLPKFIPPEKDLLLTGVRLNDVNGLKFALVNAVSGSLICQPNFSLSTDNTRVTLVTMANKVICYDPEFILKLALYTRKELNIRTTGNFLLALASHIPACRPYLKKYYSASIGLPSDWIEVAEIYQAFPDKTLDLGSLPSALRRAMVAKFPDFDKYQLAKYNKDSSKKKKNKKAKKDEGVGAVRGRGRGRGRGQVVVRGRGVVPRGRGGAFRGRGGRGRGGAMDVDSSSSDDSEDSGDEMEKARVFREKGLHKVSFGEDESPEQLAKMTFTLKQLIRKLHIREPVEHVMCLLGKKYPLDLEEFYRSRLPGTFEEERAGKRMKLPVPETWETQVSLKGNKASTWQDLIDHKKLPFMAMLRNLRNLIKAGISNKHHNWVIHKLTDERSVIFSKQFPFRFFSAYEVLNELEKDYHKTQEALVKDAIDAENAKAAVGRGQPAPREKKVKLTSENWWVEKRKRKMEQKKKTQETPFDTKLINRYRKALDTAVKIATVYNVQPIRGRTIILCDVGQNMAVPCTAARGLGKPKTMQEVSVLLGLMCKYSCEDCVMVIFDRFCSKYCTVELNKGTILENMAVVLEKQMTDVPGVFNFKDGLPVQVLQEFIRDRVQIDNLVVLSGGDQMLSQRSTLAEYTGLYRQLVNENLLYVNVSFAGNSCGFDNSIKPEHDNNIYISGFSDQILRFIAERGEGGQLRHIEMIDEKFNLKSLPAVQSEAKPTAPKFTAPPRALPITQQAPCWRSARVFISSTFKDMHGERDLLTRFVFPELRALGKKHFINVYEVDLRWGVTEEDTRSNKTLELCLTEISRCRFFLGLLGERYGWVPDKYIVPDTLEFDWVRNYPAGASVTELEMYCAALSNSQQMRDRAFFYFRDPSFEKYGWVPDKYIVPDTPEFDWVRNYPPGASVTELEMYCAALSNSQQMRDRAFFYFRNPAFEKYGWVPDKYIVPDKLEFDWVRNYPAGASVTELEMYCAALSNNQQMSDRAFFYFRDPSFEKKNCEKNRWAPDKYIVPDTPDFDWVRNYPPGASVTELEMYCAALSNSQQMRDRAFFYFRDPSFEKDIPKSFKPDFLSENPANKQKMDNLKARIRKSGLEVFDGYPCNWGGVVDGKPIVGGLDEFGMRTLNNLWNGILKEYPDQDAVLDENSHTTKLHEAFVESKKAQFVGRKKLVKESLKVLSDMKSGLICLSGKPGTGKTALLASILTEYVESKACSSGISVMSHFVGAAVGSQHIVPTLRRLCYELNCRFSLQMEVPEDYKNLVSKFEEMLKECAMLTESTLCFFMDGLDHMDSAYLPHNLDWIPATLPNNVVFVITCLTEKKVHQAMKRRSMTEIIVEGLDMWDKTEVVRNNLSTHRKSLDESPFNNQMKLLVSKKEANVPLYLSLACEELRVFGLFEKISSKLKSLPQTVSLLLQDVLGRIESDLGKDIVSTALSLLVCTRDGLEAGELHDILSLFGILEGSRPQLGEIVNIKLSPDQKLPSSTFSQLQRALRGFLYPTQAQSERLSLAHQDIENAVRQRYLKGSAAIETESFLHRLLAGYFYSQADPDRDGSWSGKSARAFCELPYHIVKSGCFNVLEEAICNLHFVHSKCILGMALQLLEDYQPKEMNSKTLEREQFRFFDKTTVKEYKSFVSRNLHILSSYPALTWQQAYNESQSSRPAVDVRQIMKNPGNHGNQASLMEWSSKPQTADPCYLTLSNLPQPMTSVSVSPNNETFTCGGLDCMVHLYDLATGKELKTFRGHADMITDVCFAGSDKICSASLDNTVSVWNVEGGHRLFTLKGHQRRVNSCAADNTGNVVVTGSWDCTIKFWNVTKGKEMGDFKVGSPVNCVAFHPEGQLIVSGQWDSTIKIWDIFHKTKKAVLRGHKSSVRDVAYSPSGRHIASAAMDGDVKLWAAFTGSQNMAGVIAGISSLIESAAMDGDVKLWAAFTGSQVGNIQGHALPINKLIFSPSGKELITVSDDHKIKVWSGHLGKPINVLKDTDSDQNAAKSVAIAPDMETVAVGYHSGKISVFDIASGSRLYSMNSHTASIQCLKYLSADYIMSGSDDNKAIVHHSSNLRTACTLTAHTKPILCVDSCTDYIATTSEDCTVMLYENPLKYNVKIQQGNITLLVTLNAHTGPVTSCTFSKDGSKIATASRDMSVIIWDIVDICLNSDDPGPLLTLSDCHADWVTDCKFSNIGDFLVTSSNDFNLKIWDTSGKERFKMTGHMGAINHVGYSYGCIVSTCADGSVKMWTHKGIEITTLYGHTQRSTGCDIAVSVTEEASSNKDSSDWATDDTGDKGKILQPKLENVIVATCGDEGDVRLWYPLQANELANLTGHSDKVIAVAANSQGHICSTSLDKSIKVWSCDLESKPLIGYHDAPVTFVSTFKNAILTGSRDGVIKVWSVEVEANGNQSYSSVVTLKVHERAVTCGCWLNSDTMITGGDDGCLRVTKLVQLNGKIVGLKRQTVLQVGSPVLSVTTNGNENQPIIITTDWSGHIKFWKNGKLIKQEQTAYSGCAWLLQAHLSGNNETLITTNDSYVLRCTFKEDAKEKLSVRVYPPMLIPNRSLHGVPTDKVQNNWVLAIDGGSDDFITGDSHGQVSVMQKNTRVSKKVHAAAVTSVIRHQDYIFTASEDKTIKVWNLDLVQVGQFFAQSPVTSMKILHSGDRAAIPLVFGDELGFVHFVTWKTGV